MGPTCPSRARPRRLVSGPMTPEDDPGGSGLEPGGVSATADRMPLPDRGESACPPPTAPSRGRETIGVDAHLARVGGARPTDPRASAPLDVEGRIPRGERRCPHHQIGGLRRGFGPPRTVDPGIVARVAPASPAGAPMVSGVPSFSGSLSLRERAGVRGAASPPASGFGLSDRRPRCHAPHPSPSPRRTRGGRRAPMPESVGATSPHGRTGHPDGWVIDHRLHPSGGVREGCERPLRTCGCYVDTMHEHPSGLCVVLGKIILIPLAASGAVG